jgi:hypothetical protein
MRRCTTKEGTIMAKSVVTGMAVCEALAVCAGNANPHAHKSPVHVTRTALTLSSLTARDGPLMTARMSHSRSAVTAVDGSRKRQAGRLAHSFFEIHCERRRSCGNR